MYIENNRVQKALVVGVDKLSEFTNKQDIGTIVILSDGAGATLLEKSEVEKKYSCHIEAKSENNQILTCKTHEKIQMNGKEIYKYAVTQTIKNIEKLLEKSDEKLENIKYIVPHQSNIRIMDKIAERLKINKNKMYTNIEYTGNTFCGSIPIAISEMLEKKLLNKGDKIILLGYGGGLNTGSILLEI